MSEHPSESLHISPIFTGLTRPPMIMGITMDYLFVTCMVSLCLYILASNPLYLLAYLPLYVMGWILCKLDPHIFRILMKRQHCTASRNQKLWGCQSYEPF